MSHKRDKRAGASDATSVAASAAPSAPAARDLARLQWFRRYPGAQTFAAFMLALFATTAFSIDPSSVSQADVLSIDATATGALYIAYEVLLSCAGHFDAVPLLALACLLTFPFRYVFFGRRDSWRPSVVLPAVLFAACMVVGASYDLTDQADSVLEGWTRVICSGISAVGWAMLAHVGIYLLYECFDWLGTHPIAFSESHYGRLWRLCHAVLERHPFAIPFATVLIVWLPTLIASIPGTFMGDTGGQIRQWFNLPSGTSDYLNLVNPDVLLNAHHPVLHTAILGSCVQLGMALFNDCNAGVFIYTVLQYTVTAASVAYAISGLKRLGASMAARGMVLAFVLFMPMFSSYAVLITKDVFFGDSVLVLVIQMAKLLACGRAAGPVRFGAGDWAVLVPAALGCTFMRNGGVVFPLAACGLAAIFELVGARRAAEESRPRRFRQPAFILAVALVCVASYWCFTNVVMPACQITPGSKREVLSIPFQQTARFVQKHDSLNAGVEDGTSDGLVTDEEREVIDRVLGYSDLASRYNPNKSDAVKNSYNESATAEDLAAYFKVWAEMFLKDPECYVSAYINNYYGYFYPSAKDAFIYCSVTSAESMASSANQKYFDFHRSDNPVTETCDHLVNLYRTVVQHVPLLSLTLGCALYVWLMIVCVVYLLRSRKWRSLALWVPCLGVLAVCLIGPCNGSTYLRYLYPAILTIPFVATITFTPGAMGRIGEAGERARA